MNVTQLETDDVVTQLETFVMMVPNIAMWGAVSMGNTSAPVLRGS
jgi:hypothetical protein